MVRALFIPLLLVALSACGGRIVPPSPVSRAQAPAPFKSSAPPTGSSAIKIERATPIAPVAAVAGTGATAIKTGVVAGPSFDSLGLSAGSAKRALAAFRLSCPSVTKRADVSGLTAPEDWKAACAAAASWSNDDALGFFASQFDVAQIGNGAAFATGYWEPEIAGSRVRIPGYDVPVYRRPADLVEIDLGRFSEALKGKKIRGKISGDTFIPYADRTAIEQGALAGRGLEIAWVASAVDFFVLQVQGSGRLRAPDGTIMRIGYDSQNGHDYTGIGKIMRDRGLLAPGKATMQGIVEYINANPEQGRAIMRENKSWVFFREVTGPGPLGALGVPVTGRASVAADPLFTPLGAPVILSMDRAEANGIWVAQDIGGAIKGANRFDTFWGAGDEAGQIAGGMSARGTAWLLLPKGVVARITNAVPTP
ncbi:MAG: murein transglycosylase A [Sphingomonadaceae bacterium]